MLTPCLARAPFPADTQVLRVSAAVNAMKANENVAQHLEMRQCELMQSAESIMRSGQGLPSAELLVSSEALHGPPL